MLTCTRFCRYSRWLTLAFAVAIAIDLCGIRSDNTGESHRETAEIRLDN